MANSQSFIYDISASALWSHVYRADTDSGPSYHYELNPVFGYQIQTHANQFIDKKELFQLTGSIGFRNYGFEGRHFEQVLHDDPNPDKLFKQFFFSKYKINSAFVSLGGALKKERFRFFTNFQVGYILNVKETRQEVHLSNIFGSEMFFPATNQSATDQFNNFDMNVELGLDYKLYKNLFLTIHYSKGIKSITDFEQISYWYESGILGIGFKYTNLIF